MDKTGKTLTISGVARSSGVNVETVRYYQRRGLVKEPPKPRQGYRIYSTDTVDRLRFIRRAQELGFTLSEIKNLLSLGDGNCRQTQTLAHKKLALIHGRIRDLKAIETVLNRLVQACEKHGDTPGCPIIETLAKT